MPKRELSKCREWERERRERLKTCFDSLARLLPSYDPTIAASKLEILQRASAHITDLQQKNKQLLLGDQKSTAIAQRDEVRRLRDRVKKLSTRSEQLANLLKSAGLKIPKECLARPQNLVEGPSPLFLGPPKLWSGRLSREKAEILQKQQESGGKSSLETPGKSSLKRKRKRSPNKKLSNLGENTPPIKRSQKNSSNSGCTSKNASKSSKKPLGGPTNFSTSANFANKVATVLGPGTLILANGAVLPVPSTLGPKATLHRIQLVPTVNQNNSQVILMKNVANENKLPIIRPKIPGNLRRNVITTKIAIPSLPRRKVCAKKTKNISKTSVKTVNEATVNCTSVITTENTKQTGDTKLIINKNSTTSCTAKPDDLPLKSSKNAIKNEQNITKNDPKPKLDNLAQKNASKINPKIQETNQSPKISKINSPPTSENISKLSPDPKTQNIELDSLPNHSQSDSLAYKTDHSDQIIYKKAQNEALVQLPPEPLTQNNPSPQSNQNHLENPEGHSELSNDIFASLGGPNDPSIGGQHTESMSPTAAFLLAFPLVSTLTGTRIPDPHNTISGAGNSTNSLLNNNNNNNDGGTNNNNNNNNNNDDDRNEQNVSPDRQSTPTTLLQIGTMNLDKSNSRSVLQIGDTINIDNNKNSRNVLHQITENKTLLQQSEEENQKNSRSIDNFEYYRDQNYQNQHINTTNSCSNPRDISSSQNIRNNRENNYDSLREPLISSVLQVSHACLYEQRAPAQNSNNFYPHAYSDIRNLSENNGAHHTENTQNPQSIPNSQNIPHHVQNSGYNTCQTSTKDSTKVNSTSKRGPKQQNQRHLVNWMTTPDIRHNDPQLSATSSDYFLPPFSDVYSGISSAISSDLNQNNDPNCSWTSGTNRNVLPTLLGDLALGVTSVNNITTSNTLNSVSYSNSTSNLSKNITTGSNNNNNNQCYHPFESSNTSGHHINSQQQQQNKENSGSFLSVSSILVAGKPRKHQGAQQNTKRHRDKTKSRESTNISSNMSSNVALSTGINFMGPNKKYGGGYSAEELIGETQYHNNVSNISTYTLTNLGDSSGQQLYHNRGGPLPQIPPQNQGQNINQDPQNIQQIQPASRHHNNNNNNNQGYQNRQHSHQQQQSPFGANYPSLAPNHGEFSALLNAAVVDTYSKSFDSFVHVKPPPVAPNGSQVGHTPGTGFEGYCTTGRSDSGASNLRSLNAGANDSDRRRHSRRSGTHATSRETQVSNGAHPNATNTGQSFSELSFLSMSGAVSSPILPDDFHASAPFLTTAPPPIPTPVASSLTNFNLSAIFPEINKGTTVSSTSTISVWPHSKAPVATARAQTRYQNHQNNTHHHHNQHNIPPSGVKPYCHSQQHVHGQQGSHESLYAGGAPSQSFPGILGHQVQRENPEATTVPTNFSFSFATP